MKLLTVDPSVNNVGFSLFNTKAKTIKKAWRFGTWNPVGVNLEMKMFDLIQKIEEDIGEFDFLCTERPAYFSSEIGQVAAHQNYTIDLAAISYYIAGWHHMDHRHHFAITANSWKGSVSKAITARRFFKRFPWVKPADLSEHAIDAIMLARFCIEHELYDHPSIDRSRKELELLIG